MCVCVHWLASLNLLFLSVASLALGTVCEDFGHCALIGYLDFGAIAFGGVTFDLGSLLQGQTRASQHKMFLS